MTGLVFAISVAVFLAVIHFPLFAVVMTYALLVFLLHELFFRSQKSTVDENDEDDDEQDNSKLKIWFDAGFLLAFVFIVWDLMSHNSISIITAFISFLLLRKSSGDLKRLTGDISFIVKQKTNVERVLDIARLVKNPRL
jgi:dipeptide/tripeptide permease